MSAVIKKTDRPKEEEVVSIKEKNSTLSGYLTFKEYTCAPLYRLSINSTGKEKDWKFIVAFQLKYEGNGKFLPSIQVWEKYKPGVHIRKANLISINGEVLKNMSKLVWRQLPEWVFELNELIYSKTVEKIRADFTEVFNSQVEEYKIQKAQEYVKRKELEFNLYKYSLERKLRELELPDSLTESEYKERLYEKIKSSITVSDLSELGEIQVFRDNFKKYINQVAREYLNKQMSLILKDFKLFELPFKAPDFLQNEDGSSFSDSAYGLGYIKYYSRVKWADFLNDQSRSIAVTAYPNFLLSVVDRGNDDGEISLKSFSIQ